MKVQGNSQAVRAERIIHLMCGGTQTEVCSWRRTERSWTFLVKDYFRLNQYLG